MWTPRLNAVLGSLVVTVGFWLIWNDLAPTVAAVFALGVAGFLAWRGGTIAEVWAWAVLLLGVECVAWPFVTMIRIRTIAEQPTDAQMGEILTSVLFGIFSGVFWLTLSWGIFKRFVWKVAGGGKDER